MSFSAKRLAAVLIVLALIASACSGSKTNDDASANRVEAGERGSVDDPAGVDDPAAGEPATPGSETDGGDSGTPTKSGGTSSAGKTSSGSNGGALTGGSSGSTQTQSQVVADLYSGKEDTIGITDKQITLCMHAALIFANAFDTRPEDLSLYWDVLNSEGGVHGRTVQISFEDDAYNPSQAVAAAEDCKAKNPFFLLSGIGFDQIPAVRNWAEQNKMLYLHHIANEAGLKGKRFSFSPAPSVEAVGRAFGEHIASKYSGKRIGILWRNSENWQPGHKSGKAYLDSKGVNVVADVPANQNQTVYSQHIAELQGKNADVVWIWENALAAAEIIKQASDQGYRPKWVVFPFQTTLDVLGDDALNPTMDGIASWPAYVRGGYGGAFSEFGYDAEIKRFEAAMAKHRPGVKPNDILWQTWIGFKAVHNLLDLCGRDCTRNKFAGLFLGGLKGRVDPNCAVDFSSPKSLGGHLGGFLFLTQETFAHGGGAAWKTTTWCREHLN